MRSYTGVPCCLVFIVLNCFFQSAYAVKPPLAERGFYQQRAKVGSTATFANPWVDIESIEIAPESMEALELRDWLRYHRTYLETWPPRYSDDTEAAHLIKAWQEMRPRVEQWQPALKESLDLAVLAVTFWVYGHNLDEHDAANRAFELIDELNVKFSSHPLPPMMKGMLKSSTGGKESHSLLKQAKARTKDKSLLGLIDMTLAHQCSLSFKTHLSLYALSEAVDACPDCVRRYKELAFTISEKAGAYPHLKLQDPYFLTQEEERQIAGSRFFGFKTGLSYEWRVDGYAPYDPQQPIGALTFKTAPLPVSGLIHGVTFFTAIADESDREPAAFLKLFGNPETGVKVTQIKPLVKNSHLTHWYRLDTRDRVGKGDIITMIAASGILQPKLWKIPDHRKLAQDEGLCERPELKPAELHILRLNARVRAPVEFTLNYSASRNSYVEAEKKMKEIVETLEFDTYALSEVEEKLVEALR